MTQDADHLEFVEEADRELAALSEANEPDEVAIAEALVSKADSLARLGRVDEAALCIDSGRQG